jgi:hypothetical protein
MVKQTFSQFVQWEKTTKDTIDFKKAYVDMAGDLVAGLLLSQIVYWYLPDDERETKLRVRKGDHLWIAKGRADWWDEVRITPKQFDRACKILVDRGLVVKANYRFNGLKMLHVRVDEEQFMEQWEARLASPPENPHKPPAANPKTERGKPVLTKGENRESPEGQHRSSPKGESGIDERSTPVLTKGENRSLPKGKTGIDQRARPLTETTTETMAETTAETTTPTADAQLKDEEPPQDEVKAAVVDLTQEQELAYHELLAIDVTPSGTALEWVLRVGPDVIIECVDHMYKERARGQPIDNPAGFVIDMLQKIAETPVVSGNGHDQEEAERRRRHRRYAVPGIQH